MSLVTLVGFDITKPGSAPTIVAGSASGSLGAGLYSYKVTFVTAFGETDPSVASSSITTSSGSINLSAIPVSADTNVTSRKIYRTASGGASWLLRATIADNTTTTYADTLADASLGTAAPLAGFNSAMSREIERGYCSRSSPSVFAVETGITAGAGGTSAAAYQLTKEFNNVTTVATLNDGVKLPTLTANLIGMHVVIKNNGANTARIYPFDGQIINGGAADAPITVAAAAVAQVVAVSATAWVSF
jgi:hypothetical protein